MNAHALTLAALTATGVLATATHAAVTDFRIEYGTALGSDGAAYTTNDLFIDFTGQYTGSQVLVTLDAGTIHQENYFGGALNHAPHAGMLDAVPHLSADTYFTHGGAAGQQAHGNPNHFGGPVNIDVNQLAAVQTAAQLAQAWAPAPGTFILDRSDFHVLRLSLSEDAQGSIQYFASADGDFFYTNAGNRYGQAPLYAIEDGKVVALENVPEPEPEPEATMPSSYADSFRRPYDPMIFLNPTWTAEPDLEWALPNDSVAEDRLSLFYELYGFSGIKYGNWDPHPTSVEPTPRTRDWSRGTTNVIWIDGHADWLDLARADDQIVISDSLIQTPEPALFGLPTLALFAPRRRNR